MDLGLACVDARAAFARAAMGEWRTGECCGSCCGRGASRGGGTVVTVGAPRKGIVRSTSL
jgi:hypothetical protein